MSAKKHFQAFVMMVQGTGVDRDAAGRGVHLALDILPNLSPRAQIAVVELAHALRRSEKVFLSKAVTSNPSGQFVRKAEPVSQGKHENDRVDRRIVEPDPRD